jgi:hypothetical protein
MWRLLPSHRFLLAIAASPRCHANNLQGGANGRKVDLITLHYAYDLETSSIPNVYVHFHQLPS